MGNIMTRDIYKNHKTSTISCEMIVGGNLIKESIQIYLKGDKFKQAESITVKNDSLGFKFSTDNIGGDKWIANYWTSKTKNDNFSINSLISLKPEEYLKDALSGIQSNVEVTALICYFDYLKTSDNLKEKQEGEFLFNILKEIIKLSLVMVGSFCMSRKL